MITDIPAGPTGPIDEVELQVTTIEQGIPIGTPLIVPWDISAANLVDYNLPGSYGVYTHGDDATVDLVLTGKKSSVAKVSRHAIVSLIGGETTFFHMGLTAACIDNTACTGDLTCIEGTCQPVALDSSRMPAFSSALVGVISCHSHATYIATGDGSAMPFAPDADTCAGGCAEGTCLKPAQDVGSDCRPSTEVCNDGLDNDCDGKADCMDPDCAGMDGCPACGMAVTEMGQPFFLPDGAGQDGGGGFPACTTDASCTAALPNCINSGCHASYTSSVAISDFAAGQTFGAVGDVQSICVNMEHSWLRDLQIEMIAPNGTILVLQQFLGNTGSEIYLGQPDDDDDASPMPGVGATYCWKPNAANPSMLSYTGPLNHDGSGHDELPPGDYSTVSDWATLAGTPLDGNWTLRITDSWQVDNGYVFGWSMAFDPRLVPGCGSN